MFDRQLLKLIGGNKKYVVYTVLLMVLGMLAKRNHRKRCAKYWR